MAEQLVAAADRQQHGAALDRRGAGAALARDHVGGDHALVAVLPAADVEEVVGGRIDRNARAGSCVGEPDPAPLAAALQEEDVAAVGVDVHLLRVEAEQPQLHQFAPFPKRTTVEPTWRSVGAIARLASGVSPTSAPSRSSSSA